MLKKVLLAIVFICAAWQSALSVAQSLYQVEVIIFERKGLVRTLGVSQTSDGRNLAYLGSPQVLKTSDAPDAQGAAAFTLLPAAELSLNTQAASLERSKQMRVLFHQGWLQPIGSSPISVSLNGGAQFGPWYEMGGSMQLSVDKNLQLNGAFWYAQFMPDNGHPITNPISVPLPPEQGGLSDAKSGGFFATLAVPFTFKQNLKPGVVTYVDHPIFGMVIKVQPL